MLEAVAPLEPPVFVFGDPQNQAAAAVPSRPPAAHILLTHGLDRRLDLQDSLTVALARRGLADLDVLGAVLTLRADGVQEVLERLTTLRRMRAQGQCYHPVELYRVFEALERGLRERQRELVPDERLRYRVHALSFGFSLFGGAVPPFGDQVYVQDVRFIALPGARGRLA